MSYKLFHIYFDAISQEIYGKETSVITNNL